MTLLRGRQRRTQGHRRMLTPARQQPPVANGLDQMGHPQFLGKHSREWIEIMGWGLKAAVHMVHTRILDQRCHLREICIHRVNLHLLVPKGGRGMTTSGIQTRSTKLHVMIDLQPWVPNGGRYITMTEFQTRFKKLKLIRDLGLLIAMGIEGCCLMKDFTKALPKEPKQNRVLDFLRGTKEQELQKEQSGRSRLLKASPWELNL